MLDNIEDIKRLVGIPPSQLDNVRTISLQNTAMLETWSGLRGPL